jgi:phage tail sheath protein FI
VSTSVTVFIGSARRGPIDKATPVRSWADFERRFGGLSVDSEMSYSVRQFFNNGGSEAVIIRVAANVSTAKKLLRNVANDSDSVLIEAADAGSSGNAIEIRVSHASNPNGFSITALLNDPANPVQEKFDNLSLNSRSPRYVESVINGDSTLIKATRKAVLTNTAGTSLSGLIEAADLAKIDTDHNQFRLSLNGGEPVTIDLGAAIADVPALRAKIESEATTKGSGPAYALPNFKVEVVGTKQIKITSGEKGDFSSVRILPAPSKDASAILKMGSDNGGVDSDAGAGFRPAIAPTAPFLLSAAFPDADFAGAFPAAGKKDFLITLDGSQKAVHLGNADVIAGGANVAEKGTLLAAHVTKKVVEASPTNPAFANFVASYDTTAKKMTFTSGGTGSTATMKVNNDPGADNALDDLHFTDGANAQGTSTFLTGGTESPYDNTNLQTIFLGSRANRTGIYALESTDIFNLLCLPGITDSEVLNTAVAYCEERRAFFIADPQPGKTPDQMKTLIQGTAYPKKKNAALYYPQIGISDPLQGGIIRMVAPSGTIAGVMARTDATRGVWKAPAGIDAALGGVQKLEYVLTDSENGVLNPRAVNCLRMFPNYGVVAWGARTLVGDDERGDEWKYIPVRRLALFIEESLYRGTKWAVFEPNDEPLWAQLRLNIGAFMHDLFRQGAFAGSSPRDAYLVQCDSTTTTQSDVNRGVVNVIVGFAPLKPAEFVFLKIQQLAGQLNA